MRTLLLLIIIAALIVATGSGVAIAIEHAISILFLPLSFGLATLFLLSAFSTMSRKARRAKPLFANLLNVRLGSKDTVGYVFVQRLAATVGMGVMFLIVHIYYTTQQTHQVASTSSGYEWSTIIPIELTMTCLLLVIALGTKMATTLRRKWKFTGTRSIIK